MTEVLGIVLAGGASRRMGTDKALLEDLEGSLMDGALATLSKLADRILISSGDRVYRRPGASWPASIKDARPDQGPLGGLATIMKECPARFYVCLSVDTPLVTAPLLLSMLEKARRKAKDYDLFLPHLEGRFYPLTAVYLPSSLPPMQTALDEGDYRVMSLLDKLRLRPFGKEELAAYGSPQTLFLNVNRPEDYQAYLDLKKRGK